MPIDLKSFIKTSSNQFANKSKFGKIIGNPIFLGCMIAIVICVILHAFETCDVTFRLFFYLSISTIGLLIFHDIVKHEQWKEKHENNSQVKIVKDMQTLAPLNGSAVNPRDISKVKAEFSNVIINDSDSDDDDDESLGLNKLKGL